MNKSFAISFQFLKNKSLSSKKPDPNLLIESN